jgi:DNA-binding LacI/PurR family transcriptional regulator
MLRAGHRHLPLVWGEVGCTSVQEGQAGYYRALHDAGIEVAADLAVIRPYDSLSQRARQAIIQSWMARDEPPTALAAGNSYTLSVLVSDLAATGLRPADFALCSFANDNPEALAALGATYVELPSRGLGEEAIRRLTGRITGKTSAPTRTLLPVRAVPALTLSVPA